MLARDPQLKAEFDEKVRNNPQFTNNQWEILNWFYNRSDWHDINYLVYPVGKL
jgi:hypothetical protein